MKLGLGTTSSVTQQTWFVWLEAFVACLPFLGALILLIAPSASMKREFQSLKNGNQSIQLPAQQKSQSYLNFSKESMLVVRAGEMENE